ncbi:alpha/beta fold hydrolase [Aureimonas frigidaquae]|uniref:Alpha/beta hydrolase n=1 Tax=Aureimonas frigidaquae TaxID=424757 RepID=A0A0P0Z035_9HYPH|nr:alpha/beta hydrolase [Aureimonas frigidaquae]BAT27220.1 alpha/beta hydrolase [Aureimonas frigidaquae]
MFEGFTAHSLQGDGAAIHARIGGDGPPLLLIHGYPQTGAMWNRVATRLAERFTVVVPDLRGYGQSDAPESKGGAAYSKRAMAADMRAVMQGLGHERFGVAGHDRGGRVAYRLALDHPDCVSALALLDILPTIEVWERMDAAEALKTYHWLFLAQPNPMPERLIGADPIFYLDTTLASWTRGITLSPFDSEALAEYRRSFVRPEHIHAACEDYRAGASVDREHDAQDRQAGRRIEAPTLVLWGEDGSPATAGDVLSVWRPWCASVEGTAIPSGHFLAEEAPDAVTSALGDFFR